MAEQNNTENRPAAPAPSDRVTLAKALFYAIFKNDEEECLRLIATGAPLNAKNRRNDTPLHVAALKGLRKTVNAMLAAGADKDAEGEYLAPPLARALAYKREDIALDLLAAGARIEGKLAFSAPHLASVKGCKRVLFKLLDEGGDIHKEDGTGQTVLMQAMAGGHEDIALELLARGARVTTTGHKNRTAFNSAFFSESVKQMMREFVDHVVLPALFTDPEDPSRARAAINFMCRDYKMISLTETLAEAAFASFFPAPALRPDGTLPPEALSDFFRPIRLARSWSHHGVVFPSDLMPLTANRFWKPVLPQPVALDGSLTLECLTSSEAFREEGRRLVHCIYRAGYDNAACLDEEEARTHFLSIRRGGTPIATVQFWVRQEAGEGYIPLGTSGKYMQMGQFRGLGNTAAPPEAQCAWDGFLKKLATGQVLFSLEGLGETQASRQAQSQIPSVERQCGYEITSGALNAAFDEYRMPYRRAGLRYEVGRLVYDEVRTEDGYLRGQHFIDGFVSVDATGRPEGPVTLDPNAALAGGRISSHTVNLRTLDALSYLRASGILDRARGVLKKQEPKTVPLLAEVWSAQDRQPMHTRPRPLTAAAQAARHRANLFTLARPPRREPLPELFYKITQG